jgi:hypothetical protein
VHTPGVSNFYERLVKPSQIAPIEPSYKLKKKVELLVLLEHASRTIHDRPRVGSALSSSFRKNIEFGGASLLQLIIKFQDLGPMGGRVGLLEYYL